MKTKEAMINSMVENIETHDKRYMFLKILFPDLLPNINIEGSAWRAAHEIYFHFQNQQMLGSLCATLNSYFNAQIDFDHDTTN